MTIMIKLDRNTHKEIHGKKTGSWTGAKAWNAVWDDWINKNNENKGATREKVIEFGKKICEEFGLQWPVIK